MVAERRGSPSRQGPLAGAEQSPFPEGRGIGGGSRDSCGTMIYACFRVVLLQYLKEKTSILGRVLGGFVGAITLLVFRDFIPVQRFHRYEKTQKKSLVVGYLDGLGIKVTGSDNCRSLKRAEES